MHYFEIEKKETTLRSRANIAKAIRLYRDWTDLVVVSFFNILWQNSSGVLFV